MQLKSFIVIGLAIFAFIGCEQDSDTITSPTTEEYNFGQEMFDSTREHVATLEDGQQRVVTLDSHQNRFVDSLNTIAEGEDVTSPLYNGKGGKFADDVTADELIGRKLMEKICTLVDDDTIPHLTDEIGKLMQEVAKDEKVVQAVTNFLNTKVGMDAENLVELVRKALNYEKNRELVAAIANVIKENPHFIENSLQALSDLLKNLPESETTAAILYILSMEIDDFGRNIAEPIWLAELDKNENPKVLVNSKTNKIHQPFVDIDKDGVCDIDKDGKPIDDSGKALEIEAISEDKHLGEGSQIIVDRDSYGRAITVKGELVFAYRDVRKTLLSVLIYNLGRILELNILGDGHKFSRKALLPLKAYQDESGSYMGYSTEGNLFQTLRGGVDLIKKDKPRNLVRALCKMIQENPKAAHTSFIGMSKLVLTLRDEEIQVPQQLIMRMVQIILSGSIPEIKEMLIAMEKVELEEWEYGYKNMRLLFDAFMGEHMPELAMQVVWPLRAALIDVKQAYPQDPQLTERFLNNIIKLFAGDLGKEWSLAPLISQVVDLILSLIDEKTLEEIKQGLEKTLSSRTFIVSMNDMEKLLNMEENEVINEALAFFLTPQQNLDYDVHGELTRVAMGTLLCKREDIATKVRVLKVIGEVIDPNRPLIKNVLKMTSEIIKVEEGLMIFKLLRSIVNKCKKHRLAPICMLADTLVDVLQTGKKHHGKNIVHPQDIREMFSGIADVLTDPNGLIRKLYRSIKTREKD